MFCINFYVAKLCVNYHILAANFTKSLKAPVLFYSMYILYMQYNIGSISI